MVLKHFCLQSPASFVSISLHLREFFEALWQEHMLASDPPPRIFTGKGATAETKYVQNSYSRREDDRKKRLIISGLTCLSQNCMKKSVDKLTKFLANQGKVDRLDKDPIFPLHGEPLGRGIDDDDLKDLQVVVEKLQTFKAKITQLAEENAEYTVEQFDQEIKQCYTTDVFENNPNLRFRVRNRLNRFVGKILVPINEANCRGVTQSSIWGCMVRTNKNTNNKISFVVRSLMTFSLLFQSRPPPFGHAKAARSPTGQLLYLELWHPMTRKKIGTGL